MSGTSLKRLQLEDSQDKKNGNTDQSQRQKEPICLRDWQISAREKLDKSVYGYFSSGSDEQITLRNNKSALSKILIYPRVLRDMSRVTLKTRILGRELDLPFGIAPIAMQKLVHPDGELLAARQAFRQNTAYGLSMLSTRRPDDVRSANPTGLKIQQLYLLKNAEYTRQFVKMVADNGFHALALTVDTQMFGKRRADITNKFAPDVSLEVFKQLGLDISFYNGQKPQNSFIHSINNRVTWQEVGELKKLAAQFGLKLILKGVISEKDVPLAVRSGADAIWISNHGGRQLDSSPATIEVIAGIKNQIKKYNTKMEIYVDGGVEKGSDVFKCLALGADFVFVGRGYLYSLIDGAAGIHKAFEILKAQLKTTMMLAGTKSVPQITPDYVIFEPPFSKL